MSKTTWDDVKKGATVELAGRRYRVVKCKPRGKRAEVMLELNGRYFESVVKIKDRVTIVAGKKPKRAPLTDRDGRQQRWATPRELERAVAIKPGDAAKMKPPTKAAGERWHGKKTNPNERAVEKILGARLVGEATDESAGYYVPPVDVSTVAAHLALFHGGIPERCEDEGAMLAAHAAQHAEALKGSPLAVNHWHTEKRP